jgi:nitrogen fixation protein FixH
MRFRIDWGSGMAALFSLFVVYILSLTFYSATRPYHLVEKDYYSKELDYQSRIEQIRRSLNDPSRFDWTYNNGENSVIFRFRGEPQDLATGEIHFYRPSDSGLDFKIPIQLNNEGEMEVSTEGLRKGLWRIKASLIAADEEYYKEDILIIG